MSSHTVRLRKAAERMTPLQIVLAYWEEARAADSLVGLGSLIASRPFDESQSILAQSERSTRLHRKGARETDLVEWVRRDQMETRFLAGLARECNSEVVYAYREWFFRRAYLSEYLKNVLQKDSDDELYRWGEAALLHEAHLRQCDAAIRRICEMHFEGVDVLLPWERRTLDAELTEASRWLIHLRRLGTPAQRRRVELIDVEAGAANLADTWCGLARAGVLHAFGRRQEATREIDLILSERSGTPVPERGR